MIALGLLTGLEASRWLVENAWPPASSSFASQAVGCEIAAAFFAIWAIRGGARYRDMAARGGGQVLFGGLCVGLLLAGRALAGTLSAERIAASDATLALALAPAVTAVLYSALGDGELIGLLWPGLGGLAGLLLLLPEPAISDWRSWMALAILPLSAGTGAGQYSLLGREQMRPGKGRRALQCSVGCVMAGLVFGTIALQQRSRIGHAAQTGAVWAACLLDFSQIILTLTALTLLGAVRWSGQFLLIPLLGLLEGFVLLHPMLEVRSCIGLLLLGMGAWRLVASDDSRDVAGLGIS